MLFEQQHKFNDDLLLNKNDRSNAAQIFPRLIHVLDFPEVRQLFLKFDKPANRAKKIRRRCGYIVVLLAVLALFGASAEPLYSTANAPWPHLIGGTSAALAIVSVLIGFGLFNNKSKTQWLHYRLMTERLRQFHFQGIVAHIPTILESMKTPEERHAFLEARRRWFTGFRFRYEGKLDGEFDAALSDNPVRDFWLHDMEAGKISESDPDLQEVYIAYEILRFHHQINYADHMLSKDYHTSQNITRYIEVDSID
jgi:hypothetical protein